MYIKTGFLQYMGTLRHDTYWAHWASYSYSRSCRKITSLYTVARARQQNSQSSRQMQHFSHWILAVHKYCYIIFYQWISKWSSWAAVSEPVSAELRSVSVLEGIVQEEGLLLSWGRKKIAREEEREREYVPLINLVTYVTDYLHCVWTQKSLYIKTGFLQYMQTHTHTNSLTQTHTHTQHTETTTAFLWSTTE